MIWGDRIRGLIRGLRIRELGKRIIPTLGIMAAIIVRAAIGTLLAVWFGWFAIIHPLRVERELASIRETVERTDRMAWVIDERACLMDDQLQTLQDEIVMWHAENRSLAKLIHGRQPARATQKSADSTGIDPEWLRETFARVDKIIEDIRREQAARDTIEVIIPRGAYTPNGNYIR